MVEWIWFVIQQNVSQLSAAYDPDPVWITFSAKTNTSTVRLGPDPGPVVLVYTLDLLCSDLPKQTTAGTWEEAKGNNPGGAFRGNQKRRTLEIKQTFITKSRKTLNLHGHPLTPFPQLSTHSSPSARKSRNAFWGENEEEMREEEVWWKVPLWIQVSNFHMSICLLVWLTLVWYSRDKSEATRGQQDVCRQNMLHGPSSLVLRTSTISWSPVRDHKVNVPETASA